MAHINGVYILIAPKAYRAPCLDMNQNNDTKDRSISDWIRSFLLANQWYKESTSILGFLNYANRLLFQRIWDLNPPIPIRQEKRINAPKLMQDFGKNLSYITLPKTN